MNLPRLSRREWLTLTSAGVLGASQSGWLENLARSADVRRKAKSCILLWMSGGPSQMDTFDLKPGHKNGGPFKEIATSAPGLKISEHFPKIAKFGHRMAVVRSLNTKEGDHGRATHLMHTSYFPQSELHYPSLGSAVSKELSDKESELPSFVCISPYRQFSMAAFDSGFLGPQYAPLIIADNTNAYSSGNSNYDEALKVRDIDPPTRVTKKHWDSQLKLLGDLEKDFLSEHPDAPPHSHQAAYERAVRLMKSSARKAFDLQDEKPAVRDAYGRNIFGQGCLLARRLVEKGVSCVEIALTSDTKGFPGFPWDTHSDTFETVKRLSGMLDAGWSQLMIDLQDRGLLDSTLIVWMGEFGRTPQISGDSGRDHYPNAFSGVLAGGGIRGGQAIGKTSPDGTTIVDRPVSVPDFLATAYMALGIDPMKQNQSEGGRPIEVVDRMARPIEEIVG